MSEYIGTDRWAEHATPALSSALHDHVVAVSGAVLGVACVDRSDVCSVLWPAGTRLDGRFEIASITKTMTGALLALLAGDGIVRLDDPVGNWLDAGPNSAITLRELATHTSGLPEASPNYDPASMDPLDPWAGFGAETAQEGLQQAETERPGESGAFLYSNFGYQLLGLILERASGSPYPQLIAGRLFDPLGISGAGVGAEGPGIVLAGHGEDGPAITRCQVPPVSP